MEPDNSSKFSYAKKLSISKSIKALREKQEISIGILSMLSSIPEERLCEIEQATADIDQTDVVKIAIALSVPANQLHESS